MSNEKNFVSELVQMARAFEELPVVQADLNLYKARYQEALDGIQRLEMRLIDAKNEIDAAHAATTKAEVERDHAETMFLETDQKLDALRGIFSHFQNEVVAFNKASEPEPVAPPEPTPAPLPVPTADVPQTVSATDTSSDPLPEAGHPEPTSEPSPATNTEGQSGTTSQGEDGGSGSMGESAPLPTSDVPTMEPSVDTSPAVPQVPASGGMTQPDSGQSEPGPTAQVVSVEPTPDVTSGGASKTESVSQPTTIDSSTPQDDVGYHNEPMFSQDGDWHTNWGNWADRMNSRYGEDTWPARVA